MLEVSDLNMVETISTTGSLTRAAEVLNVSQPTLSKRLARLEHQLNTRLFQRGPTGLKPTQIAHYLIKSATQIKANVASVERHVERLIEHDAGDIRVGVGPIIEQVLFPPVLIDFAKRTGNVRLYVVTDRAEVLLDQLMDGALDLIAGPYDHTSPDYEEKWILALELIRETTINVARPSHPIFDEDPETAFINYPYAAPPRQGAMSREPRFSNERSRVSADNYALLKRLVLETDFICGGPRELFRTELEQGSLREIDNTPSLEWQSACLMKTEAFDTPLVNLLVEIMLEQRDRYLGS